MPLSPIISRKTSQSSKFSPLYSPAIRRVTSRMETHASDYTSSEDEARHPRGRKKERGLQQRPASHRRSTSALTLAASDKFRRRASSRQEAAEKAPSYIYIHVCVYVCVHHSGTPSLSLSLFLSSSLKETRTRERRFEKGAHECLNSSEIRSLSLSLYFHFRGDRSILYQRRCRRAQPNAEDCWHIVAGR